MAFKIIRTIIGLPLILTGYPPMLFVLTIILLIQLVFNGCLDRWDKEIAMEMLTFPYRFIKKVWSKGV